MGRATDLSNCYIYHIVDKEGIVHYVGSTSNMNSRKSCHKYRCNNDNDKCYHLDIYNYIRDHGGFDNFEIIPIHKIENISNKTELRIAEQQEINKFSGLKNKHGSYRSSRKEINKIYYEKNKELCKERRRQWAKNNPEKEREIHKNYKEENRDQINEKRRQRWHKNKDKINEKRRQKYQQKKELEASEQ